MFVVGLTGGVATGKSTVANFFKELGCPVIDADFIAKEGKENQLSFSHFVGRGRYVSWRQRAIVTPSVVGFCNLKHS